MEATSDDGMTVSPLRTLDRRGILSGDVVAIQACCGGGNSQRAHQTQTCVTALHVGIPMGSGSGMQCPPQQQQVVTLTERREIVVQKEHAGEVWHIFTIPQRTGLQRSRTRIVCPPLPAMPHTVDDDHRFQ